MEQAGEVAAVAAVAAVGEVAVAVEVEVAGEVEVEAVPRVKVSRFRGRFISAVYVSLKFQR